MSLHDEDRDLREAFGALRKEERLRMPRFNLPAARERGARSPWSILVPAGAAVAALAAWLVFQPRPTPSEVPMPSLAAWREPTAFLLQTPGHELLWTIPDLRPRLPEMPTKPERSTS